MFRINISEKGKTFHVESESEALVGKQLNDKISGIDVSPELNGYEFQITGASDKAGFPMSDKVEGIGLKGILIGYGVGLKKRARREGKKKRSEFKPNGLRMRRKARGKIISPEIMQINLKVLKEGNKKLSEVFSEQNKAKEEKKMEAPAAI